MKAVIDMNLFILNISKVFFRDEVIIKKASLHSLKHNKACLIMKYSSIIPATQLINPISASCQDQHNSKHQEPSKGFEPSRQHNAVVGGTAGTPMADPVES